MRTLLTLGCLILASTVGAKDLIIRQRSSAGMGGASPKEETVYLAGDKIVTESTASRTIVDLKGHTITAVDMPKRTYTTLTFDELHAQMQALKQSFEQLPPEARQQMGALFGDGASVSITPTGKTDTIATYTAKEYAVTGDPYTGSVWVTDALATPSEFKSWKRIEQEGSGAARRLGEALEKIDGFPLRTTIQVKAGQQTMMLSNEVLEVREGAPPPDVLKVPSGFAKETPQMGPPPPKSGT